MICWILFVRDSNKAVSKDRADALWDDFKVIIFSLTDLSQKERRTRMVINSPAICFSQQLLIGHYNSTLQEIALICLSVNSFICHICNMHLGFISNFYNTNTIIYL